MGRAMAQAVPAAGVTPVAKIPTPDPKVVAAARAQAKKKSRKTSCSIVVAVSLIFVLGLTYVTFLVLVQTRAYDFFPGSYLGLPSAHLASPPPHTHTHPGPTILFRFA